MENRVTVSYGVDVRSVGVEIDSSLGDAIIATGLSVEQPCAGRGTCLKCKVMAEGALTSLDEHELAGLSSAERAAHYRLACRAGVAGDARSRWRRSWYIPTRSSGRATITAAAGVPLGLAMTWAAPPWPASPSPPCERAGVCAARPALNAADGLRRGCDLTSRRGPERPATAGAVGGVGALLDRAGGGRAQLAPSVRARIRKVTIVGNCAMHHLLVGYPVDTLAEYPFQPHNTATVRFSEDCGATTRQSVGRVGNPSYNPFADIFPSGTKVALPPLIGGFVGSDALACLIYYGFDRAPGPMAAIDLGTNGEVMVTDGRRILVGSTAAGPAFEGVNISCGTRAVDGAIVGARVVPEDGSVALTTVGDQPPVGLTGSGLLALVCELRRADVIDAKGRIVSEHPVFGQRLSYDEEGVRRFLITDQGVDRRGVDAEEAGAQVSLYLTQYDVREMQKAKGAIRAAFDTLMAQLDLQPASLQRTTLTGSFGSQLDVKRCCAWG